MSFTAKFIASSARFISRLHDKQTRSIWFSEKHMVQHQNMHHTKFPIFPCETKNLIFFVDENCTSDSDLDSILKEKWNEALKNGIFRYNLDIKEWKILDGQYRFLAQLNLNRASMRRKPEDIRSISQPFDASRFHFNKISNEEIMFDVECGDGNNVIAVNVSPIDWGHCLLLTERFQNLPQRMTQFSLRKALELLMMSNSVDLRAAFNSLGAYASVNHLHWHFYYLRHRMPLESIILEDFKGPVGLLTNFPAKGFCISLSSIRNKSVNDLASSVFIIVNYLQNNNVPHSVYITRGKSNSSVKLFDDVRVYIWARKPSFGVKDTSAFIPAVCELFGHLSIRTQEGYMLLTEHQVAEILDDVTSDIFYSIKEKIAEIIEETK